MNKKQIPTPPRLQKRPTIKKIMNNIYGPGGIEEEVKAKVKDAGVVKIAKMMKVRDQNVYGFLSSECPKIETLAEYAAAVGVE